MWENGEVNEQGSQFETPFGRLPYRKKSGLEAPLSGRFYGENKRLVFAPPLWYDLLVLGCIVGGILFSLFALANGGLQIGNAPMLGFAVGLMVSVAGTWAALSNERMSCDLRSRYYARLEGQGLSKRVTRGSLDQLDAVVLMTEQWAVPVGVARPVVYRLVVHWKGGAQPLLIVESERHMLAAHEQLNHKAGRLLLNGSRYAKALGVTFYDNSYYHSPGPLPAAM
jgi:hypothetical protein